MKADKNLDVVKKVIEKALSGGAGTFGKLFRESSAGKGKYVRAKLFFEFSGRPGRDALATAAAIEILHMATLVHDDILDGSSSRRGMPPLYVGRGVKTGILYGDLLFSVSHQLLERHAPPGVMQLMNSAVSGVIRGEIIQHLSRGGVDMKKRRYLAIAAKKTGSLFSAACGAGAVFGGFSAASAAMSCRFGELLGTAYQVLNDCGDVVSAPGEKGGMRDVSNGIVTLPLIMLLERCSPREKSFIKKVVAADACRRGDAARINRMMLEKGAVSAALVQALRLTARAETLFREIFPDKEGACGVLAEIEEKIKNAQKKHSDSWRRVCGA